MMPLTTSEGETTYLPIFEGAHFAFKLEPLTSKSDIVSFFCIKEIRHAS